MQTQTQTQTQPRTQAQAEAHARDVYREQIRQQVRQQIREVRDQMRDGVRHTMRGEQRVVIQDIPPIPPIPPIEPLPPFEPVIAGSPQGGGEQIITVRTPHDDFPEIPQQAVDISMAFFMMVAVCVVGWPLARAFGRRIERRPAEVAAIPAETGAQLQRIEQSVEAMAIEIERISESQRFLTRLQSERDRLPISADARQQ